MTTKQWTGTGQTDAATATTTNSNGGTGNPSGNAFDAIPLTGDGTAKYSSLNPPFTGWRWLRLQSTTGKARAYHSYPASDTLSERKAVRLRSDPGVQVVWSAIDTAFGDPVQLQLVTSGGVRHLVLHDAATQLKDYGAFTFGSGAGTFVWIDVAVTKGTSGHIKCKVYSSAGTLIDTFDATANTGTNQFIRSQWGGNTGTMDLEVTGILADNDAPADYEGLPTVSSTPPVATIMDPPDPFEPGTVTVTGTITASGGNTVKTATMTIVEGPNSPTVTITPTGLNSPTCTVTATFTAESSAHYLVRLAGTNNVDTPSNNSDVVVETYATPGTPVNPYQEVSATSWPTLTGSATNIEAVTDSDDASYRETSATPAAAKIRHRWCPFRLGTDIVITPRLDTDGTGTITYDQRLYRADGTTLVDEETGKVAPASPGPQSSTFPATSLTTIALRRGLVTEIEATQ